MPPKRQHIDIDPYAPVTRKLRSGAIYGESKIYTLDDFLKDFPAPPECKDDLMKTNNCKDKYKQKHPNVVENIQGIYNFSYGHDPFEWLYDQLENRNECQICSEYDDKLKTFIDENDVPLKVCKHCIPKLPDTYKPL